jgi:putative phosphoribosyl transferase
MQGQPLAGLPMGLYGASTGAAAAVHAAAARPKVVQAIVLRGGRPDLANDALPNVLAPTLLIVGSEDAPVIDLNRDALDRMKCERQLRLVPGASHLFDEPGALDVVAALASSWYLTHLP